MTEANKQNFLKGAAILAAASIFVKIVGAIYKIPIFNILDDAGIGAFQVTYNIYVLILTIATAGLPVALSRLVASANATGKTGLVQRYFSVALPAFALIGIAAMLLMYFFAVPISEFYHNTLAAPGIRVLAPAVFFVCIIAVYRGYAQGFENMVPTAMSQVVEVVCKAAFGIVAAVWLAGRNFELQFVSAGSISGVTVGLFLCVPLLIYYKRKIDLGVEASVRDLDKVPGRAHVLGRILKVSVPITIGASLMSVMNNIDTIVINGRLQNGLGLLEEEASAMYGIYTKGLTIFNLPPALIVPIAVSVVPAIAAARAGGKTDQAGNIMQTSVKLVNLLAMPAAGGIMALSGPILTAVYGDTREITATILTILGAASFFVCLNLITTAILQANGHERITMLTFPIGGVFLVGLDYVLVGNPNIGIVGSPVGTLACYVTISALNIIFILAKVKDRPKFSGVFIKPLACTAVMGIAAYAVYGLLNRAVSGLLGEGRMTAVVCIAGAIAIAVVLYGVLVIATHAVTREDMKLVPKGEKLADILKIR